MRGVCLFVERERQRKRGGKTERERESGVSERVEWEK